MSTRPELSIVVPAYREGPALADNLTAIIRNAKSASASMELIAVDDGSPDDTWETLAALAQKAPELRALRFSRNFGKEAAILAGLSQSRGAAVIVMDSDLQHPPELIAEMMGHWRDGNFDIVNAVKRLRQKESSSKAMLVRLYHRLFSGFAGLDLESSSDFKLLDRVVVDKLCELPERQTFFRGLVAWIGFRQTSVSFDVPARQSGQSSWSIWKLTSLAINSILSFSTMPMHLITGLGVLLALVSSVLGIRTLWLWAAGEAVPGFTTVILLQIFFSSILMIGLGIIGAYIAKIYDEVKRRPRFLIHDQALGENHRQAEQLTGTGRKDRSIAAQG